MASWIPVTREAHGELHWLPRENYSFAELMMVTSASYGELAKLVAGYALGFIQQEEQFRFVALLGLGIQRNFYVNNSGQWLGQYVPASLRSYPFAIAQGQSGELLLCVNETAICNDSSKPQFYDAEGNLDSRIGEFLEFLKELESSKILTQNATNLLTELDLITPWNLEISSSSKDGNVKVDGLFRINEENLNKLAATDLERLRNAGALSLAYGQILSMNQLDLFASLSSYHEQSGTFENKEKYAVTEELGSLNFDNF